MKRLSRYLPLGLGALLFLLPPLQAGPGEKIHPRLWDFCQGLQAQTRSAAAVRLSSRSTRKIKANDRGEVQVYVYVRRTDAEVLNALKELGLQLEIADPSRNIIQGWLPYQRIEAVAALEAVTRVRAPIYAHRRTGRFLTEGDAIHQAPDVRAEGHRGAGVKVGVISDGIESSQDAVRTGDLPNNIQVGTAGATEDEGTAMLEIIHDLAPGASLAFSAGNTSEQFIQSIRQLQNLGCEIIVDDLGFSEEPYFEDGDVADAAQNAVADGVFFVSAAGNESEEHYEADFAGLGAATVVGERLNDVHDFGAGDFRCLIRILANEELEITLQWNNRFGAANDDYDLYLIATDDSQVLASSKLKQDGNDDPLETVTYGPRSHDVLADVVITRAGGGNTRRLEFFMLGAEFVDNFKVPAGAIYGHPGAEDVFAVGAIDARDAGNDALEAFSNRGPSRIDFPSRVTRDKPQGCGIDKVEVSGVGGFGSPFPGTSAAAPHLAAIAALLLEVKPDLAPNQVTALLRDNAVDLGTAGFDYLFGGGRADALASLRALERGDYPPAQTARRNEVRGSGGGGGGGGGGGCFIDPRGGSDFVLFGFLGTMLLYAAWRVKRSAVRPRGRRDTARDYDPDARDG